MDIMGNRFSITLMMTDDVEVVEKKTIDFIKIWNISEEDDNYFHEIMRQYGKKGNAAFHAILENYSIAQMIGELLVKLRNIEERLQLLENKDIERKVKTFGGG